MYCQGCGFVLSQDARFCKNCGKPQSPAVSAPMPSSVPAPTAPIVRVEKRTRSRILWLVLVGLVLIIIVSQSPWDNSTSTGSSPTTPPASTAAQPPIARPTVPPPKFRIYKFKLDEPTAIVVPIATTDEQLKSLLWFFRAKVRSHQFKDIGLRQATAKQWGNKGYLSWMLLVYRGEKCANETYVDTTGPCGYGEHDDATYQWGIEADPNKDSGSMRVNGDYVSVFDYKDGWQVAPAVQEQLDEQSNLDQAQRDLFAQHLQQRLTGMGYDINVWVHGEGSGSGRELVLDSEMFKDTATRVQFINSVLPQWKKDLCKAGFRKVRLRRGGMFELGEDFSLGCENL